MHPRIAALFLFVTAAAFGQVRGIPESSRIAAWRVSDNAGDYRPGAPSAPAPALARVDAADYVLIDQVAIADYLLPRQRWAVSYEPASRSLALHLPAGVAGLNEAARAAAERAPDWLSQDLRLLFTLLTPEYQTLWANAILEAEEPFIDEVAFAVAHASPQYLMSGYGSPALFLENARSIYANDVALDYVEVVDYGTAASDPDYYTTTRYKSLRGGSLVEVTAPREVYYWYIVYPRATSEIPAWIDPSIPEDNGLRNNNLAAPPAGVFWRDWLLNHADDGYPRLRDLLAGCGALFDGTRGKPDGKVTAMGRLNTWMERTLAFDSREERPHQPVRIYRVHMGRCGEWSDLRNAAARSALIPCTSVASYSTDHVWNEFWDGQWYHWDNETNYPLMYYLEWGKVFGTVFEIRSDGALTSVTNRYTRGISYIDLYVTDKAGRPVDGAEVNLYTKDPASGELWWDMYALTDDRGMCTFMVGKNRSYYATITSAIGNYPVQQGNVVEVVANAVSGSDYSKKIKMTAVKPAPSWTAVAAPADAEGDYYLEAAFTAPKKLLNGAVRFDDVRRDAQLYQADYDGSVDFYFADSAGFAAASEGRAFNGVGLLPDSLEGYGWLSLPAAQRWYAVFGSEQNSRNVEQLAATVRLFACTSALTRQELRCTAGWNWIGLNVVPATTAVGEVLTPLGSNALKIRALAKESVYEAGKGWSGSLENLVAGKGYLLQLADAQDFTLHAPLLSVDQPLALEKGWNWVAYLPHAVLPVAAALAPVAGSLVQIKGQQHSAMYVKDRWIGDLTLLEPGAMYKILMNGPATLTWPNPQPALEKGPDTPLSEQVITGTPGNMVVIARIVSSHPFAIAGVVDEQGRARGYGVPIPGTGLHYFTIVGETENEPLFVGLRASPTGYQTDCLQTLRFRDDATLGSLDAPVYLSDQSLSFQLQQNHPNPFNGGTTITYALSQAGRARLAVYNRLGQEVRVLFADSRPQGEGTAHWDGRDEAGQPAAAGVYIVRLEAGDSRQSRKILLLR
ncbi:MAG TPA: FlgD immunoglobulin-like domain containing protein [bacterium]|nr:FlgD immunoglobulin-like domain containing protein [bacterium]HQJ64101.1 FlgD immunoglobulin-like domain containing protein [bacterium]